MLSAEGAGAPLEVEAVVDAVLPELAEELAPGAELLDEELEPLPAPPPPWASAKVGAKASVPAAKMVSDFIWKLLHRSFLKR